MNANDPAWYSGNKVHTSKENIEMLVRIDRASEQGADSRLDGWDISGLLSEELASYEGGCAHLTEKGKSAIVTWWRSMREDK